MADNPFAAPTRQHRRAPVRTWSGWLGMGSSFAVGRHRVEVETGHWTGLEIYRVDGEERQRTRNLGWHATQRLDVGGHEVAVRGRWYPVMPVTVEVDGVRWIDDLFPQIRWPVRLMASLTAVAMATISASIAYDLWRWVQLG